MKLPLTYYGNPVLRKKGLPVTDIDDSIRQLVKDMEETMHVENGCGLAAPQVNKSLALFITSIGHHDDEGKYIPGETKVYINPKILEYSNEMYAAEEGCLSIPKLKGVVNRPAKIKIQATNLEGQQFTEEFEGYDAHVFLHENDHINGVLYIDRLSPKDKQKLEPFLREIKKTYGR